MDEWGRYLSDLLTGLGYRVTLRSFADEPGAYFSSIYGRGSDVEASIDGWVSDYPSASNFLQLGTCGNDINGAHYCDPALDRMFRTALAAEATGSQQAGVAWAEVDHRLADASPFVDLLNPTGIHLTGGRVGNYQYSWQWGVLLDQLWVR
jgi:peptide/nickel transport system substrate-binding protein